MNKKSSNQPDYYLHELILELLEAGSPHNIPEKAAEIAEKMPSEHRQKLIDLGYMAIESSDTPVVWWAYLFELAVPGEKTSRLKMLREMLDHRIETGKWM